VSAVSDGPREHLVAEERRERAEDGGGGVIY
jgi:hypothetical protein